METQAVSLLEALPTVPMHEGLRASALELSAGLKDASGRVTFELALLQAELAEGKAKAASAVQRLAGMESLMMDAVAAMTDVVDELEKVAERDETYERSFVLVIEATAAMLQGLAKAKAATQALEAAGQAAERM
jgi:phage-related tail protein